MKNLLLYVQIPHDQYIYTLRSRSIAVFYNIPSKATKPITIDPSKLRNTNNFAQNCSRIRVQRGTTLFDHKRNEEILELHVTPLEDKLCTYRHMWFQHVHRMEDNRLPKQLLNYHPKGRWQPGRPRKRLLDDMTAETETGLPGLNSWLNMMMMMMIFLIYAPWTEYRITKLWVWLKIKLSRYHHAGDKGKRKYNAY
jgi:hypothetical protein